MPNFKVLIAEDNELNMKLFRDLLEFKNIATICVSDGHKVIDETMKNKPDLILMDIRLNDISGLDLIKKIKLNKEISNIPIIALTAFAMKKDQQLIRSYGCEEYMSKPIAIDNFFNVVNKFITLSA